MSSTTQNVTESVREVTDEVRNAFRTAGHAYLDAADGVLESMAAHQDKLKTDVDHKWLADVIGTQADFTRRLLKVNAAQRERLS